ncbi:isocitrate lyase/PEP mutase family protein [Agarivorans sp. QJM3NY_33]|uniref:isocitrate lyase/PEP mutase family protein n=1 Tax=Agarivorans sp. QJM3NY_33 TaxID=3421432 RepID=UPI003D7D1CD8
MQEFKLLHQQAQPLLIANVWDAISAKCAQNAGYQALGTSSAAIAGLLGYEDGEEIPFKELRYIVSRIKAASCLPLTVDIEAGFSRDPKIIVDNIQQLLELGVVGINIEDSRVGADRTLVDTSEFTKLLAAICYQLQQREIDVFINVRCDVFLLGIDNAVAEAVKRIASYQRTGIHGLFFPCLSQIDDIKTIVKAASLPINVMTIPELPDFEVLASLGVKRISMGNFAHQAMHKRLQHQLLEITETGNWQSLFSQDKSLSM